LDIIPGSVMDIVSQTHGLSIASRGPVGNNHVFLNPFPDNGTLPLRNGFVGVGTFAPVAKLHVAASSAGRSIHAEGNVTQDRGGYGLPKAMLLVWEDKTISRCYNAVIHSSSGNCGFSVSGDILAGYYEIDFGFQVNDRFVSATLVNSAERTAIRTIMGTTGGLPPNRVGVWTYRSHDGAFSASPFFIFVY
jgi:hypothetical protein